MICWDEVTERQVGSVNLPEQVFERSEHNPILTVADLPFQATSVLNPGAAEVDGEVVLFLRVETMQGYSDIYTARSRNGVTDWQISPEPILQHGLEQYTYEAWGCEDARATRMDEDGCWYITYVAVSAKGPAVGLARSLRPAQGRTDLAAVGDQ